MRTIKNPLNEILKLAYKYPSNDGISYVSYKNLRKHKIQYENTHKNEYLDCTCYALQDLESIYPNLIELENTQIKINLKNYGMVISK